MAEALALEGLEVRFGGLQAITGLTFAVEDGEILSLIGPNGAGKTTAFNVITGYLAPSGGSVRYRDRALTGLKPYRIAQLGVVRTFQKTSVFANNTVLENLLIGMHLRTRAKLMQVLLALPAALAEERMLKEEAREILEFVGLGHRSEEPGGALPYGEQRLLEVAVALAAKPSFLLLDEPASGMNPTETGSFMRLVERIRERGITILLVEHDMRVVMNVSDRVVVLNQGRMIATGAPAEIQRDPDVLEAYLGPGVRHA